MNGFAQGLNLTIKGNSETACLWTFIDGEYEPWQQELFSHTAGSHAKPNNTAWPLLT